MWLKFGLDNAVPHVFLDCRSMRPVTTRTRRSLEEVAVNLRRRPGENYIANAGRILPRSGIKLQASLSIAALQLLWNLSTPVAGCSRCSPQTVLIVPRLVRDTIVDSDNDRNRFSRCGHGVNGTQVVEANIFTIKHLL